MGRHGDEGSSRGGPASRCHIDHYWNLGLKHALDDIAHRAIEPSGRVQLDDACGPMFLSMTDAPLNVPGKDGVDRAIDPEHIDIGGISAHLPCYDKGKGDNQ